MTADRRPLVMHVMYMFDVGGLENGVVNLINHLPADEFRHVVVALTQCAPGFCARVERADVEFISLHKPPGQGWRLFPRIWRLFRKYRPSIVHTRNLAALEMQLPASAAGVPVRVHGEHGRDVSDPYGRSRKYRLVRRAFGSFVTHYVALSRELEQYLLDAVGIAPARISCITNGVDERKFTPRRGTAAGDRTVIGLVGRLDAIKGQPILVEAVDRLVSADPPLRSRLRVQVVGDGPLRGQLERDIAARGLHDVIELVGVRNDIPGVMRGFDVFVLPSIAEGISNTVLEAMATGLPIVATDVGGNSELIDDGRTGTLVPAENPDALAAAIKRYLDEPRMRELHGRDARAEVEARFSLTVMIDRYRQLYRAALADCAVATGKAA